MTVSLLMFVKAWGIGENNLGSLMFPFPAAPFFYLCFFLFFLFFSFLYNINKLNEAHLFLLPLAVYFKMLSPLRKEFDDVNTVSVSRDLSII